MDRITHKTRKSIHLYKWNRLGHLDWITILTYRMTIHLSISHFKILMLKNIMYLIICLWKLTIEKLNYKDEIKTSERTFVRSENYFKALIQSVFFPQRWGRYMLFMLQVDAIPFKIELKPLSAKRLLQITFIVFARSLLSVLLKVL